MKKKSTSLLMYVLLILNPFIVYSQSAIVKKINFTIKDAVSGRPIEGAQVTLKGLLKKTKTAKEDGSVNFEIPLIVSSTVAKFEISDGSIISGHKNQYIEITLRQGQDIYDYPITLKSDYKRVAISVTDEKLKTAIAGARVNLRGVRDTKDENALTDGGGVAFFDVLLMNKAQTIPVNVSKVGFENFTGNININERTDQYPLSVSLKKNKYAKILRVTVVNEKDGTPIPGTKVSADQSFLEIFSDQTGQDGVVDLVLTNGGSFKLLANAGNFEPAEKTIEINRLGDQEIYEEKFQLKKKEFMREMRVTVLEEIEPGQMRPKQGAVIYVNGVDQGTTGADGKLVTKHNKTMGDLIIVKASAYENDPETQNITVGGTDWRYFPPQYDLANFILKYKPSKIKLTVLVSDYINNKPIALANTVIKSYAGNAVSETVQTNSQGEATFNIETKTLRSGQFRLIASATDYEERWSDIPGDLLKSSEEIRFFAVSLKKKNDKNIRRDLKVFVREYETLKPIPNATVNVEGYTAMADENGTAFFPGIFEISDVLRTISVTTTGYEQNQKNYRAGGGTNSPDYPYDEISIQLEKKATDKLQFVAQVYDRLNNKRISGANVVIKTYSGNAVSEILQTNINGEASLYVDNKTLTNGQFRLIASAPDYEEKWSDISSELLASNTGKRYLQIYLSFRKKIPGKEIKYGPFTITPKDWVSTSLTLPKGGSFRVEATGEYTSVTEKNFHSGPAGGGWGWWSLVGKIGDQRFAVGSNGGGTSKDGGLLELGTPRVMNFYDVDKADLQGVFTVYVYANDAIQIQSNNATPDNGSVNNNQTNNTQQFPNEKIQRAKNDFEFLITVLKGEKIPNKDPEQIAQEVKAIIYQYDLNSLGQSEIQYCIGTIKVYHEYFYNRVGNPSDAERRSYYSCVNELIDELKTKIENKQF